MRLLLLRVSVSQLQTCYRFRMGVHDLPIGAHADGALLSTHESAQHGRRFLGLGRTPKIHRALKEMVMLEAKRRKGS